MPERVVHERAHPRDLVAQRVVEELDRARLGLAAPGRRRRARARARRRGARRPRDRAAAARPRGPRAPRRPRRPALPDPALPSPWEGSYCGSTSTLNAAARCARSPATALHGGADRRATRGRARSPALTTTWARSRPRRRNSGAGPSASAPGARAPRAAAAARAAPAPRRRADDADERRERRVAQRLAALELAGEEAVGVVARGDSGSTARRARASARARGRRAAPRPARPASWATSANVRSSARKSGKRSVASASSTTPSVDVGEVVALGDHLRADEHAARRRLERAQHARRASATSASRRKTGWPASASSCSRRSVPGAVAARSRPSRRRRSASAPARGGRSDGRRAGRRRGAGRA